MGRPTLYTPERKEIVLRALRLGLSYETAAKLAKISKVTLYNWRQEHEDFAEECESVIGSCEERLVGIVDVASVDDPKWAAWLLERRFPKAWGNLRPEVLAARTAALEAPERDASDGVADDDLTEAAKK